MFSKSRINFLFYVVLACLWSGSFIGIKEVVNVWPPLFGAAARVSIALLSLMILAMVTRKNTKLIFSLRWKIWIIGLFSQGIPYLFLFWGERNISPGLAGIINATCPIWTFILSLIFLPNTTLFSMKKIIGLMIGILGIVIIFWPMVIFEKNIDSIIGTCSVMIMAISYAISNLLNEYLLKSNVKIDFLANVYHQHWASAVFLIIISAIFETWPNMNTLLVPSPWFASLYLGVLSTAIAFVIYYHLIREWDSVRASSVMYVVPVLTFIWDDLFFNNHLGYYEAIGIVAILIGVILIQFPKIKLFRFEKRTKAILSADEL